MNALATRPWLVGALVRDRTDSSVFAAQMVLGYRSDGRVLTVSVQPPPWATRTEQGVRTSLVSTLRACARTLPESTTPRASGAHAAATRDDYDLPAP